MYKKGQLDLSELNPMAAAAGLLCGVFVFAIMGYTGTVQVGLFMRVIGFLGGCVAGYLIFSIIANR